MAMKKEYYTCNGRIIGEKRSDEERSRDYICDPWGNVIAVYQADWQIAAVTYDPWGEQLSNWNASSYRYLWGGGIGYRQTNKEWATHYVRARHYSFMDGTWTTQDPLWPQEPAYRYVGNMVTRAVDYCGTKPSKGIPCKECEGGIQVIRIDKDDNIDIVRGDGGRMSGAECIRLAKELFPGRECTCVNGGFFSSSGAMGAIDPCNGPQSAGTGTPAPPDSDRSEVILRGDRSFVTAIAGTPPSPKNNKEKKAGRTAACIDKNGRPLFLYIVKGCAAVDFENCIKKSKLNCPSGSRFVWLDGGGSSQMHRHDAPNFLLGNSSSTGKPDGRSVDNWIIVCD